MCQKSDDLLKLVEEKFLELDERVVDSRGVPDFASGTLFRSYSPYAVAMMAIGFEEGSIPPKTVGEQHLVDAGINPRTIRAIMNINFVHDLVDKKYWNSCLSMLRSTDYYTWCKFV